MLELGLQYLVAVMLVEVISETLQMATFTEAFTRLMRVVNRPVSETDVLAAAKESINDAILFLQRNHAYNYTEKLATFTYPVNTLSVDLGDVCEGPLRDILSIQQVSADGQLQGKPLKIMSYTRLQAMRNQYARRHSQPDPSLYPTDTISGWTIEDAYRQDLIAFMSGQFVGLYPMPTEVKYLLVNAHIWLPQLEEDDDENFFLTYALDIVLMVALKRMHIYMKTDSRFSVTEQEVADAMTGLVAWDSSTKSTPFRDP